MKRDDQSMTLEGEQDTGATIRPFPGRKSEPESHTGPATDRKVAEPDVLPSVEADAAPQGIQAEQAPPKKKRNMRKLLLPIIGAALLAGGAYYGYDYWTVGRFLVSTDDAYLTADIADIAPKIQGYVSEIAVKENQRVKAGDVLVRLDDGDYRIALDQAKAAIVSQDQTLNRIKAQTVAAQASVAQANAQKQALQATLDNAKTTAGRARSLLKTQFASQSQVDDANATLLSAQANMAGADAQIAAAKANVQVLQAQYSEAKSQMRSLELAVDQARRNLDQTVLKAPFDGIVGNRAVERGDLVSPGQKLAALVPVRSLYVKANLKETQLAGVVPGEKVKVSIDALDGKDVEGTVSSIAPASGSVFSLLPPENATGNFTKVVQRVPVRIDLPASILDSGKLHAGLSVVIDIDKRTAPKSSAE